MRRRFAIGIIAAATLALTHESAHAQALLQCPGGPVVVVTGCYCCGEIFAFPEGLCDCPADTMFRRVCHPPGYGGVDTPEGPACGIGVCWVEESNIELCHGSEIEEPGVPPPHEGENPPPVVEEPPTCGGKPVSLTTGEMFLTHTDAVVGEVVFTRTYNTKRLNAPARYGFFGRGWNSTLDIRLRPIIRPGSPPGTPPDVIEYRGADGSARYYFDPDVDGTYHQEIPNTLSSHVETLPGGGYKRVLRSGGYEEYSSTTNRILKTVDAAGIETTFTPDSQGRIGTITRRGRSVTIEYDTSDRPTKLRGPDSAVLAEYAYASQAGFSYLDTVGYPEGGGYVYVYDVYFRIVLVKDGDGNPIEAHEYSAGGGDFRAYTSEIADGQEKLTFDYSVPNQTIVTDALNNETKYHWKYVNHVKRVWKVEGPCQSCGGGGSETQEWAFYDDGDPQEGNIATYTNGVGKTWSYTYDADTDDLLTIVEPGSAPVADRTTTYTYYGVAEADGRPGLVKSISRPAGAVVEYKYGPAGPTEIRQSVTASEWRTTTMTYSSSNGRLESMLLPGHTVPTQFQYYSGTADLWKTIDPLSHVTTFAYDVTNYGRLTHVYNHLNHDTYSAYDGRGRLTSITDDNGTVTRFAYDTSGRRIKVTDPSDTGPDGPSTWYSYDAHGRLATVVDAAHGVTRYGYDAMSNLASLTDARGKTTSFSYVDGRLDTITYPGGAEETFTYDDAGQLQTRTDRKAVVTTYTYDDAGRLRYKQYSDGTPTVEFTYHPGGQLATAANGTDTVTLTYDYAGQLLSEQSSRNASTVAYEYWPDGSRKTVKLNGTLIAAYTYRDDGPLERIDRGGSVYFDFAYDEAHRRSTLTYPNGAVTTYTFNGVSNLTNLVTAKSGTTLDSWAYGYDAVGNRTSKTALTFAETYKYDDLYRLVGAERTGLPNRWFFDYDPAGNRLRAQTGDTVSEATYDDRNQLQTQAGEGSLRWRGTIDEPGNVTFTSATVNDKPARMLSGNTFETTLDLAAGLNTVTIKATDSASPPNVRTVNYQMNVTGASALYDYDANGNLTEKLEGATNWTYEWNAENQLKRVLKNSAEVARFAYDALGRRVEKVVGADVHTWLYDGEDILRETEGGTTYWFLHGPGIDEPLARYASTGQIVYGHADGLGSLTKVTNPLGEVIGTRRYDPFGNIEVGAAEGSYAFTGREWDPETGLYYYRARYYDPKVGRFISEDPLGFLDGPNLYTYAQNSPATLYDPFGTFADYPAAPVPTPSIPALTTGARTPRAGERPGETIIVLETAKYCIYGFYTAHFGRVGSAAAAWITRQRIRELCNKPCIKCPGANSTKPFFRRGGVLTRVDIDCSDT